MQAHFLEKGKGNRREREREEEKTSPEAMTLIDHAQSWKEIYFRVGRRKISCLCIYMYLSNTHSKHFEHSFKMRL